MRVKRWSGMLLTLAACVSLSACGTTPSVQSHAATSGFSALADDEDADLPLDQLPTEKMVVPTAPTRRANDFTQGNAGELYVSPDETLPALKALINNAKKSVYIETFNFGYDSYGQQIVPLLIAKAKQGVEVKVMMDWCGSRFITPFQSRLRAAGYKQLVQDLRNGGVEVHPYRPRLIVKDDHNIGINITHRKVYLADGEHALIGGVNLMAPFDTTTQDIFIDWRGPVVGQLYGEFAHDWSVSHGGPLKQVPDTAPQGNSRAKVVVTSPGEGRFEAKQAVYQAVENARHEIDIEQQYLFDDGLMQRLHAAVKRGVKLRVIVPGPEQKGVFVNIHMDELHKLTQEGAEARLYHGNPVSAHLHVKYFCVDDAWAMEGSCNGDTRGFIENNELSVITTDPSMVALLKQRLFEADWAQHTEPYVYQPGSWVIRRVRNLLELIDYYL